MTDQTPADTESAMKLDGILPAIAAAMGDVQKVGKADRNKHDGYNFASIDNFLSLANPICARHGLIIVSDEVSREDFTRKGRNGELPWMRVSFSFVMYHISGQSLPPMTRSVEVMRNGAQAYGSAQSYCLKQFLRGLFLIPTGDKDDADYNPTDAGQIVQDAPEQPRPEAIDAAVSSLGNAATLDALKAIFTGLPEAIRRVPAVVEVKDARKAALHQPDFIAADEIPY
jgi:hypothetical protein